MNITRYRGDTVADVFTITNRNTRSPVNVSGATFKFTINRLQSPPDVSTQVYQLTGVLGSEIGEVSFAPTDEQADVVGYFYYDIEMKDSYGAVSTILSGGYTYIQDITKA